MTTNSTACLVCTVEHGAGYADKHTDWLTVDYDGKPVHKMCVHHISYLAEHLAGTVEHAGTWQWASNGQYLPDDAMRLLAAFGYVADADVAATKVARDEQTRTFLAEYRRNAKPPTAEEKFEMRAAFGPGTEVVNVITGHRTVV